MNKINWNNFMQKISDEDKIIVEEKYDDYLKAEIAYAKSEGWTDDEIQRLLIDDNYFIIIAIRDNEPNGYATELARF